jgi:hypothetical protein
MTALNVFLRKDAVHVLTDGAACDPNGDLVKAVSKVFPLAHTNAVLATRGVNGLLPLLGFAVDGAPSFDATADILPAKTREILASVSHAQGGTDLGTLDVVLAGISETRGPACLAVFNHSNYGVPASELQELDGFVSPSNPELFATFEANGLDIHGRDFNPEFDGPWIMSKQRDIPGSMVGCFCQLTTVTADEITTRIVRRWPDRVGLLIDPALGPEVFTASAPPYRQAETTSRACRC